MSGAVTAVSIIGAVAATAFAANAAITAATITLPVILGTPVTGRPA